MTAPTNYWPYSTGRPMAKTKKCPGCDKDFPYTPEFFYQKKGRASLSARCKPCHNLQCRKLRREKWEQYRLKERDWAHRNRPKLRIKAKRYYKRIRKSDRINVPETLRRAVRRGLVIKKPCEVCGDFRSQGHHDDYTKPLEVRWLCPKHHHQADVTRRAVLDRKES